MNFNFEATGIGSVPFKDPKTACRLIFDNFTTIPSWPQLPKRSFLENMYVQFSEGLPGLVLDEKERTLHIETSRVAADIEKVYQKYLDGEVDFFAVSEDRAAGLYEFLEELRAAPKGEFSFAWTTPLGKIALNGTQANTYPNDQYLLALDTGGNDRYEGGVGTGSLTTPVSVV